MMKKMNLGFLASGRGSNMQAIINACNTGKLDARPVLVISNNPDSGALEIARKNKIPCCNLNQNTHPDSGLLDKAITDELHSHHVDLVILAGYMKKIGPVMLKKFHNRILNIHPSLLPKYGGQGMYGHHVHSAVIQAGEKTSGATVHLVDDEYDKGLILAQRPVTVTGDDDAESLAAKVLGVEHELYVEVLQNIISGKIRLPEA